MRGIAKGILLTALIGMAGCARQKEVVVAEVGEKKITDRDIKELAGRLPSLTKEKLLWTLIDREILVQEARARGLDKDPGILDKVEKIKRVEMDRLLRKRLMERISVSEDEARKYYRESGLASREEVRARHIMVRTEEEADEILNKLKQGMDFAELARKYSLDEATSEKGGDLGYWREGEVIGATARKIFSMKVGEISKFKDPQGYYHVIEVLDRRPVGFEAQKKVLVNRIKAQKLIKVYQEYMDKLKEEVGIEVEPGIVDWLVGRFSKSGLEDVYNGKVVITYKGGEVHLKDYISWLKGLRPKASMLSDSSWVARSLETLAVDWILVPYAARKEGIDRSDWLRKYLKRKIEEMMVDKLKATEVDGKIVTPKAIEDFYDKYKELYYYKPPVASIRAVRLDSMRWAEEALRRMEAGEDMEEIAKDYPPFHGLYQNCGEFKLVLSEKDIVKKEWLPYLDMVRKMKVGEMGGPIELLFPSREGTLKAYVVFKVVKKEPQGFHPLSTPWVKRSVILRLKSSKGKEIRKLYDKWIVGLRAKYKDKIKIYKDRLEAVEVPQPRALPGRGA